MSIKKTLSASGDASESHCITEFDDIGGFHNSLGSISCKVNVAGIGRSIDEG